MLTRKQLTIEMEKLRLQNDALRREILIYNRLHSLNEAHLAIALERAGAMEAKPLVVTKEQIRFAMEKLAVKVEQKDDSVSLWVEFVGGEADGEEEDVNVNVNATEQG